ncbi:MAG: aldehyde:ferredoxin oxidoreductase, partial [Deltaproteobacteria bacterium]|nr:aldehyde:ferredoxin oxidoreductase [Deltaproteobacteria bacterium]
MYGFYSQILVVDLTDQGFAVETVDEEILQAFLGGKGLGSYLLSEFNPPQIDPFSPENHVVFATGPACGSFVWGSSRYGVFTKSPQTGLYSESYSGGRVPEAIDATGYDALIIKGRSPVPTVLAIRPGEVVFHEAGDIWGMDTYQAEDEVIRRFAGSASGKAKKGAIVIGPAGENHVCFSVIENYYWRSAGRTGVGCVLGSKRLKAILFQGDCSRKLADRKAISVFAKGLAKKAKDNTQVAAY